MKKYKTVLIAVAVIIAILIASFFMGSDPGMQTNTVSKVESNVSQEVQQEQVPVVPDASVNQEMTVVPTESETTEQPSKTEVGEEKPSDKEPDSEKMQTGIVPDQTPEPVEPENATVTENTYTCTMSISCATVLDNMDQLAEGKADIVPTDGWVLCPVSVTFHEGESVFDVLQRVCMENKIHMEFMDTPIYNSAYIEGIANLYEFDCGNLSGWMYSVNGWFPNYGCSRYALQNGDVICWVYTCDLGEDVGDNSMSG